MIDQEAFSKGIELLCDHYDRSLRPEVIRIWKQYLDERLTTEEFTLAVKTILLESRFFPTAKDLVCAAKGDEEARALIDWSLCHKEAAQGNRQMTAALSRRAHTALYFIGGLTKIANATDEETVWLRKEFVRLWQSGSDDKSKVLGLPEAPPQSEVKAAPMPPEVKQQLDEMMRKLHEKKNMRNKNE